MRRSSRVLDGALVLHAEHGMNASTFAARVTAATLADMHAAVTSATGGAQGPAARRGQSKMSCNCCSSAATPTVP